MKSFLVLIYLIIFSLFNNVNANNNIVFIDVDTVLSDSIPGSDVLKQLTVIKNNNLKDFKKKSKLLKEKEKKIIKQKNILSPEDFQSKVQNLKNEVKTYNEFRESKIKNYNQIKLNNTNKLLGLINPIIIKYTKDESISLVLQKKNLILGKVELDITKLIIELVNKNVKEFKIE